MLNDFETLAKKKGVVIDSVQYEKDKTDFRTRIKAEIARIDWGNEGWFSVYSSDDHQLQKALGLFPEAAKIAGLN